MTYSIPWAKFSLIGNELRYTQDALESTWVSGGKYIEKLEKIFTDMFGTSAIAVNNGTLSLMLIYIACGLKRGDEIIVPMFGYQACTNVAIVMGITPIFADIKPDTWCICPESVEQLISEKTKAIVLIHSYGASCNISAFKEISKRYGLFLIEDIAESLFSRYDGRLLGSYGDFASLSLHATKTISSGEGGIVFCQEHYHEHILRLYRSHGLDRSKEQYLHLVPGLNFRLSNILAAVGFAQMEVFEKVLKQKEVVASSYREILADNPTIVFQGKEGGSSPVYWANAIYLKGRSRKERNRIIALMANASIELRPGFYTPNSFPYLEAPIARIAQDVADRVVVLPSYHDLTSSEIEYVCDHLLKTLTH